MIHTTKYLVLFFFLISMTGLQNCDFFEETCKFTRTKKITIILDEHLNESSFLSTGREFRDPEYLELGYYRVIRYRFHKKYFPDLYINDICSVHPFIATLKIVYNPKNPPTEKKTRYTLFAYFPSVPPSRKILDAKGTEGNAGTSLSDAEASILIDILPNTGGKYLTPTWLEFGIEVWFPALNYNEDEEEPDSEKDFIADLEDFQEEHLNAELEIEYYYF